MSPVGHLTGILHLVALQLDVVVVAPHAVEPLHRLLSALQVAGDDLLGHFAADTGRADDQPFAVLLQRLVVGAGAHVVAFRPAPRHQLHQVVIARLVLGQHDEVPSALVRLALFQVFGIASSGHIHLAAENGLEGLLPLRLTLLVHPVDVVEELLHAEHVAVIRDGHTLHAVGDGFIHQTGDGSLSVQQRILGVHVQMYEIDHNLRAKI